MKTTIILLPVFFTFLLFTTDSNAQWTRTAPTGLVRCFVSKHDTVFVGTDGNGVLFSTDNGNSWMPTNNGLTCMFTKALIQKEENLFVGTDGGGIASGGVFLSTNKGNNWIPVNTGMTSDHISVFAVIDSNLFAGTTNGGVFLSTNNGTTWTAVNSGLGTNNIDILSLAVVGKVIFAGTYGRGIFRSFDNGKTWAMMDSGLTHYYISTIEEKDSVLYIGTDGGIFSSTDLGTSWSLISSGISAPMIYSLAIIGDNLIAGTHGYGHIYFSSNNGTSWRSVDTGLSNTIDVFALTISGTTLFAGTDVNAYRRDIRELIPANGIETLKQIPSAIKIFPNPFSVITTISFTNAEVNFVSVSIFDLLGKECAHLFSGELDAGEHSFEWDASRVPAGMYLAVIRMNGVVKEIPLVVAK